MKRAFKVVLVVFPGTVSLRSSYGDAGVFSRHEHSPYCRLRCTNSKSGPTTLFVSSSSALTMST